MKKKKSVAPKSRFKRAVKDKALKIIDESLAALPPNLKTKLEDVKAQITVTDLRFLGLKVLERARLISAAVAIKKAGAKKTPKKSAAKKTKNKK